jgi:hypothetical protein
MGALMEEYWPSAVRDLIFFGLGSALALGIRAFLARYVGARADSIAADVNLPRYLARTYADQGARALALRLDAAKAEGAMKILGLMAEIEATLFNWKLTAYFHLDELKELETVEDLALRDLKQVATLLVTLLREASSYSVLLGDEVLVDVMAWIEKVHEAMFDFCAVYQTSKRMNQGKSPSHNDRVTTVSSLMQNEVYPKLSSLGEFRKKIREKLSKNVQRSVAELVR